SNAQVCTKPAVTATALVIPCTCTEVNRLVVEPSPSCPKLLFPQQRTVPSAMTAQEWLSLVATPTALFTPCAATALALLAVVPLPSWPRLLSPQQATVPSLRTAQVWAVPGATATALGRPAMPTTATGVWRSVVVLSPSCPELFFPQQRAL